MMDLEKQMEILLKGVTYPDESANIQMREELKNRLKEKGKLKVYLGVDPTTKSLHLGHLVPIFKLKQFQDLGHETIFLIGDFTGMIGDPTGQSKTRPQRTREEVLKMAENYMEQVFRILDESKTRIVYNSEWLSRIDLEEFIKIASKYTLAKILSHEDFKQRYTNNIPISFHELIYPLLQAYDAYYLKVDIQIGGVDQWFNMLAGRILQEAMGDKPHIPLTLPILIGTDGKLKMSQSYGNDIPITLPPEQMYGKIMSIPDELMKQYFLLLTDFPEKEIEEFLTNLHPKETKKKLAYSIVKMLYNEEKAAEAENYFESVFEKRGIPQKIKLLKVSSSNLVVDILYENELVKSKSEARRLIEQGAIEINGEKIKDINFKIDLSQENIIKVGKRGFFEIKKEEKNEP